MIFLNWSFYFKSADIFLIFRSQFIPLCNDDAETASFSRWQCLGHLKWSPPQSESKQNYIKNLDDYSLQEMLFILKAYRVVRKSWDSAFSKLSENWDDWDFWNWTQNPPPTFAQSKISLWLEHTYYMKNTRDQLFRSQNKFQM